MPELRWSEEIEEVVELLYRLVVDHEGRLLESEALDQLGPWITDVAKRAENLWWLAVTGSPPVMKVTYGGRKALDAALAAREAARPEPQWFGGSIVDVYSETGPVLPTETYEPYEDLKQWAMDQEILTEDDIERIASSPRQEDQEPEDYRMLDELSFPGTRGFAGAFIYEDGHPFGGGIIHPKGHEGPYQVTVTLTRRGAPDISFAYVTDAYMMEGDSHLRLPQMRTEDDAVAVPRSDIRNDHRGLGEA